MVSNSSSFNTAGSKFLRKGLGSLKCAHRFYYDGINWELRMIFSDSVTQQFSDPHSIGFKGPYPKFQKLTLRTRDTLFLPYGSAFPFLLHSVVHHPQRSRQLFHPLFSAHLPRFEFSFLPSSALLGPRPLWPNWFTLER